VDRPCSAGSVASTLEHRLLAGGAPGRIILAPSGVKGIECRLAPPGEAASTTLRRAVRIVASDGTSRSSPAARAAVAAAKE
jgi:hypothetical protein